MFNTTASTPSPSGRGQGRGRRSGARLPAAVLTLVLLLSACGGAAAPAEHGTCPILRCAGQAGRERPRGERGGFGQARGCRFRCLPGRIRQAFRKRQR